MKRGRIATALAAVLLASLLSALPAASARAATAFEFFNPTNGMTVTSRVQVVIRCSDPAGLARAVINAGSASEQTVWSGLPDTAEAQYDWDTVAEFNGTHSLGIHCWNGLGQESAASILVTVQNKGVPTIDFQAPPAGAVLDESEGPYTVRAQVNRGDSGENVKAIRLYVDEALVDSKAYTPGRAEVAYSFAWDLATVSDGQHTLKVFAESTNGKKNQADRVIYKLEAVRATFYFAEGTTRNNFVTYLCVGNPTDQEAFVVVDYLASGTIQLKGYPVGPRSRLTVDVSTAVGHDRDTSITVRSDRAVVVERPMYFNYGGVRDGGSDTVGAVACSSTWYFAEGTTRTGFDTYLCIENPQGGEAATTLYYMVEGEGQRSRSITLPTESRTTVAVADQIGWEKDFSVKVVADREVVAERPTYFNYRGTTGDLDWTGGHVVVGLPAPQAYFYFAEGATYANFEEWLCLQNPHPDPITVEATYMLDRGEAVQRSYQVPANQRRTINVKAEVGPDRDVSLALSCTTGFVAERPMYFDYHGPKGYSYTGGHDVVGAIRTATEYSFAEGYTAGGFDQWFCIQNPGGVDAAVTVTYYLEGGGTRQTAHIAPARSRYTIYVNSDAGEDLALSSKITSDRPIIAERPMYFAYRGGWTGGHDVVGFSPGPF